MNARASVVTRKPDTELMVEELMHRINNELMAAISVVSLAAAKSRCAEAKALLHEVTHSLTSFARLQRALEVPRKDTVVDAVGYLDELCAAIAAFKLACRDIRLTVIGCEVRMTAFECWCLGLIVSELVTNAIRHAFTGNPGTITVSIERLGSQTLCLVEDDGGATKASQPGRGHKILTALAASLGGSFQQEFSPSGARCSVTFQSEPV